MSATVRLFVARFPAHDRAAWQAGASALLDVADSERVAAMVDPGTRAQHAVGRALIRAVGALAVGCHPRCVAVAVMDSGKPWLPQRPDLHVNVSHTHGTVVLAVTAAGSVGVDIEPPVAVTANPLRLAERLFAESEARELGGLSEEALTERFTRMWTIKEAVGKALGVGLIPALAQTVVASGRDGLRLKAVAGGPPAESWTLHQLTAPRGKEKIAVAVPTPDVKLDPLVLRTVDALAAIPGNQGATARTWPGSARWRALK